MKKYANAFLKWITSILEVVIALILAVTIIIMTFQLILSFQHLSDLNQYPNYDDMLTTCFNLIIGVEMIRMLYLHTPITVFEVLLFAIARQIIIEHGSPLNSLIGVIAIAILFATRKFLFMTFDESEKIIFRSSQKVKYITALPTAWGLMFHELPRPAKEQLIIMKRYVPYQTSLSFGLQVSRSR